MQPKTLKALAQTNNPVTRALLIILLETDEGKALLAGEQTPEEEEKE